MHSFMLPIVLTEIQTVVDRYSEDSTYTSSSLLFVYLWIYFHNSQIIELEYSQKAKLYI